MNLKGSELPDIGNGVEMIPECCARYKDHIFVFGSNEAGRHGAGAAAHACLYHGAVRGQGFGMQGTSFAIPTKDVNIRSLPLENIATYVAAFCRFARRHVDARYYVTRIGCGLAGYTDEQIAPMFRDAPENCFLPEGWRV